MSNPNVYIDPNGENAVAIGAGIGAFGGPVGVVAGIGVGVIVTVAAGVIIYNASEHTKNARQSTKEKHEKGQTRKQKDSGGEKGDARRKPNPNKRH
jgi:hypothetical protein